MDLSCTAPSDRNYTMNPALFTAVDKNTYLQVTDRNYTVNPEPFTAINKNTYLQVT